MQIWRSPRLLLAAASLLACLGIVHGADKSPGEMANAATKFLADCMHNEDETAVIEAADRTPSRGEERRGIWPTMI